MPAEVGTDEELTLNRYEEPGAVAAMMRQERIKTAASAAQKNHRPQLVADIAGSDEQAEEEGGTVTEGE